MYSQFTNDTIRTVNKVSIFEPELIYKLYHKSYEIEDLLFYTEGMWFSKVKCLGSGHTLPAINLETFESFIYVLKFWSLNPRYDEDYSTNIFENFHAIMLYLINLS